MTTLIIDTRTIEAKKMLEFLKTTRYVTVLEENMPNEETLEAIQEVEKGNVTPYSSVHELMSDLQKSAGV